MTNVKRMLPVFFAALLGAATACNNNKPASDENPGSDSSSNSEAAIPDKKGFQTTVDGKQADLYILKNKNGASAAITSFGGKLVSLLVPDKNGKLTDVVVGFKDVEGYQKAGSAYYGALIGRYGNRIGKSKFKLDGKEYTLAANNGPNTLHGGNKGFDKVVWNAKQLGDSALELTYLSKDMEEGYPGNLNVKVTYTLTDNNELKLDYQATTDKKTVVNLTNHAYFNLNGGGSILNHTMQIYADKYTPVDSTLIPTGKLESVAGTPFDFRKPITIGAGIDADNQQIKYGPGYDHNFVLNKTGSGLTHAATVVGDKSGIVMDVYTQEPGIQFYSGNFMKGENTFKSGDKDEHRTAFCLETQHFPDSPNQPSFPSTTLSPGQTYKTQSIYKFSIQK